MLLLESFPNFLSGHQDRNWGEISPVKPKIAVKKADKGSNPFSLFKTEKKSFVWLHTLRLVTLLLNIKILLQGPMNRSYAPHSQKKYFHVLEVTLFQIMSNMRTDRHTYQGMLIVLHVLCGM